MVFFSFNSKRVLWIFLKKFYVIDNSIPHVWKKKINKIIIFYRFVQEKKEDKPFLLCKSRQNT